MRIFITGIGGFVGSNLASSFRKAGHIVGGSSRQPGDKTIAPWELGRPFPEGALIGYDAIIHAAWDLNPNSSDTNLAGTMLALRQAKQNGIERQLFVSSHSARANAATTYGMSKFATEKHFLELRDGQIIRPGLVIGAGGMFGRMHEWIRRNKIIPLIGGGRFAVPFVAINDLTEAVLHLLESGTNERKIRLLYHPTVPDQRSLVETICRVQRWRRLYLPVPAGPLMLILNQAEILGVSLPVRAASVRAALENETYPQLADLSSLVANAAPLDSAVLQAFPPHHRCSS